MTSQRATLGQPLSLTYFAIDRGRIHDQSAPNIIENGVVDQKLRPV